MLSLCISSHFSQQRGGLQPYAQIGGMVALQSGVEAQGCFAISCKSYSAGPAQAVIQIAAGHRNQAFVSLAGTSTVLELNLQFGEPGEQILLRALFLKLAFEYLTGLFFLAVASQQRNLGQHPARVLQLFGASLFEQFSRFGPAPLFRLRHRKPEAGIMILRLYTQYFFKRTLRFGCFTPARLGTCADHHRP